jgi:phage protein D
MSLLDALGLSEAFREPAECAVEIDGAEISDLYPYLTEVRVEIGRGKPGVATLTFESVRTEDGDWLVQDDERVAAWKPITIKAVFGEREDEVMRGYVRSVEASYPDDSGGATVTVTAQDETVLLDRETIGESRSTSDSPATDGALVSAIGAAAGLSVEAEDGLTNSALHQSETDVSFLYDRAQANGFELYTREGTLYFHPPDLGGDPQATIMVQAGRATNCVGFSATYDGHRPDKVRFVRAAEENGAGSESEELGPDLEPLGDRAASSDDAGLNPFVWEMRADGATLDEARARAQAKANENAWKVTATGELDGSLYGYVLQAYRTVVVDGVGDTYGGTYYVDEVKHHFSNDGYTQEFKLLRNATGGEAAAAAG